jgi:hypothetical protein
MGLSNAKKLTQQLYFFSMNEKTSSTFQTSAMMNHQSKKKALKKTSTKSFPQSRKKSAIGKSAASSQASTPASRASIASSRPLRHATV